jgi:hypothetical protein
MRVVELRDLAKRESPVHYIKELTGVAVLEWGQARSESDVAITLEHKPLGPPDVRVRLLDPIDLPTVPVMRAVQTYVAQLEREGKLP